MTTHGFVSADALSAVTADGTDYSFRFDVRVGSHSVRPTCQLVRLGTGKWWAFETGPTGDPMSTFGRDETDRLVQLASLCPRSGMLTPHFARNADGSARFHWLPLILPTFRTATGFKDAARVWRVTDGMNTLYVGHGNREWYLDGLPVIDPRPEYRHLAESVRWLPAGTPFAVVDGVARPTVTTTLTPLARPKTGNPHNRTEKEVK